jgi:hypothetical protein
VSVTSIGISSFKVTKRKLTQVVVHFSGALEGGVVQNTADYELGSVTKGKKGRQVVKPLALDGAAYVSNLNEVLLLPQRPLPTGTLQLTIVTSGVLDAEGRPIQGNPGGNLVATFGKAGITLASAGRGRLPSRTPAEAVDTLLAAGQLSSMRRPWPDRP